MENETKKVQPFQPESLPQVEKFPEQAESESQESKPEQPSHDLTPEQVEQLAIAELQNNGIFRLNLLRTLEIQNALLKEQVQAIQENQNILIELGKKVLAKFEK